MKMPTDLKEPPTAAIDDAGDDPFLRDFYARIPAGIARSFSAAQLMAIRMAFGARTRGAHSVDLRLSMRLLGKRAYLVLLAGTERRSSARLHADRRRHPLVSFGNIVVVTLFGLMLLAATAGFLYLLKSALGIDLFPGFSLGFWDATRQQLQFLFQ